MPKKTLLLIAMTVLIFASVIAQSSHFGQHQQRFDIAEIDVAIRLAVDDLLDFVPRARNIAVVEVNARGFERPVRNHIARAIEMNFGEERRTIVDREHVELIVDELGFQAGMEADRAFSDQEKIRIGARAGADYILTANLGGGYGVPYTITLEVINVSNSQKRTTVRPRANY